MSALATRLLGSEAIAEGTRAFHFARPEGFLFKAGQAVDVLLDGGAGDDHRHTFSIASAPSGDRLTVATRMRDSAFKQALGALPAGGAVQLEGPSGSLTLHGDASRPAVFVAGGIGIAAMRAMLNECGVEDDDIRSEDFHGY